MPPCLCAWVGGRSIAELCSVRDAARDTFLLTDITYAPLLTEQDGWVVVEQLLRPEALKQLLTFLTESTIYHTSMRGGRHLAAYLAEGLSAPLIAQLAEELRAAFPSILGKHTLTLTLTLTLT